MVTFGLRLLQTTRSRRVLALAYGLAGMPALPTALAAFIEGVDVRAVQRILGKSLRDLAERFSVGMLESLRERDRRTPMRWRWCPPPKLYRDKRQLHSWGYTVGPEGGVYFCTGEWAPLKEPLAWGELLPRLDRTVAQLAIPTDWLHEPPTVEQLALDGTDYDELRWSTDEHELLVLAIDGICDDLAGEEVCVQLLFARLTIQIIVNGEQQFAELCLMGIDGAFQAASIEGQAGKLVARAWG